LFRGEIHELELFSFIICTDNKSCVDKLCIRWWVCCRQK